VKGGLNLSRAFGDHQYKQNRKLPLFEQMVTAKPGKNLLRHFEIFSEILKHLETFSDILKYFETF
jgi:hypothetical protein